LKDFKFSILTIILLLSSGSREVVYAQWTSLYTGTIEYLFNVNFPSPDTGYVVQQSGMIRKSVNGGQSWSVVNSNVNLLDFAFTNTQTGFGNDISSGTIYRTNNGGQMWDTVYDETGLFLWKIYNQGENFIYSIGGIVNPDSGIVISSYDGGLNWTRYAFAEGIFTMIVGSSFVNPSIGYACDFSSIFKTLDSGQTWVNLNADPNQAYNTVYFLCPDTGFALATVLLKTTDGGQTWNQVNTNGNNTAFYDMKFVNDTVGYVVGGDGLTAGPILKTIDRGENWSLDTFSVQTFMSVFISQNTIFASGTGGALWKQNLSTVLHESDINSQPISLYYDGMQNQFIINGTTSGGDILVYNSLGVQIKRQVAEGIQTKIEMENFAGGLYFIQYKNQKYIYTFKGITLKK